MKPAPLFLKEFPFLENGWTKSFDSTNVKRLGRRKVLTFISYPDLPHSDASEPSNDSRTRFPQATTQNGKTERSLMGGGRSMKNRTTGCHFREEVHAHLLYEGNLLHAMSELGYIYGFITSSYTFK